MKSIKSLRWRVPGLSHGYSPYGGVAALLALVFALAVAGISRAGAQEAFDSACRARAISAPSTTLMTLRDELSVVTRARFDCFAPIRPFHLSIVADAGSILTTEASWVAPAIRSLGERIRLDLNDKVRVGAIEFDDEAATLCDPTGDAEVLRACLERLGAGAAPSPPIADVALGAAVVHATHQLARIRSDHSGADAPHEVILVLVDPASIESSPEHEKVCDDARRAISAASTLGIKSKIVCLADTCRKSCVNDLVDAGSVHRAEDWPDVSGFIVSEAWASELRVRRVAVHERLGAGFKFKLGSPDPGPDGADYHSTSHTLDWRINAYGRRTIHLSYALSPRRPGMHAIRDSALGSIAQFTDTRGGVGTFDLGNSLVGVVEHEFHTAFLPQLHQPECELCVRPDRTGLSAP